MFWRQGGLMLQAGAVHLILASLEGFALEDLAAPQLGLTAHKLAGLQSVLLAGSGSLAIMFPGPGARAPPFALLAYSAFAILAGLIVPGGG